MIELLDKLLEDKEFKDIFQPLSDKEAEDKGLGYLKQIVKDREEVGKRGRKFVDFIRTVKRKELFGSTYRPKTNHPRNKTLRSYGFSTTYGTEVSELHGPAIYNIDIYGPPGAHVGGEDFLKFFEPKLVEYGLRLHYFHFEERTYGKPAVASFEVILDE